MDRLSKNLVADVAKGKQGKMVMLISVIENIHHRRRKSQK